LENYGSFAAVGDEKYFGLLCPFCGLHSGLDAKDNLIGLAGLVGPVEILAVGVVARQYGENVSWGTMTVNLIGVL
jgi:hypothetical protein